MTLKQNSLDICSSILFGYYFKGVRILIIAINIEIGLVSILEFIS